MLTISAPTFDVQGSITVNSPDPEGLSSFRRRVSRSATLDGGASINDFGYSVADRTLQIEWDGESKEQIERVTRMAQSYGRLIIGTDEGCFIGAPENFSVNDDTVRLTILVERRLDL